MFSRLLLLSLVLLLVIVSPDAHSFMSESISWEKLYAAGELALEKKNFRDAEQSLQSALYAAESNIHKQIMTLDALASLYEEEGNLQAEEEILLASVRLVRNDREYSKYFLGSVCIKLTGLYYSIGLLDDAESFARQAVDSFRKSCVPLSPSLAVSLNNLAWVEEALEKSSEAEAHFLESIKILEKSVGRRDILYGLTTSNLARFYDKKGNVLTAIHWYEQAGAALNVCLGSNHTLTLQVRRRLHELQSSDARKKPH